MILPALSYRIPGGQAVRPLVDVQVARDGPLGVFVPLSAADWTKLGLPPPLLQFNCQEASGDLAPAIGALTFFKQGSGELYQQTVAGWSRKFVGTVDGTAGQRWDTNAIALNLAAGESMAMLVIGSIASPGVIRDIYGSQDGGAGQNNRWRILADGTLLSYHGGNQSHTSAGSYSDLTRVRAMLWYRDGAGNRSGTMTDTEHLPAVHDEVATTPSQQASLGSSQFGTSSDSRTCLYALWKGVDAETIAHKTTLDRLGWPTTWQESVMRDGPGAGVFVPQGAPDFVSLGLPVPDYLFPCQEGSGSLVPSIGNTSLQFAPSATPLYQQAVTGWLRKFVGTTVGTVDQRFATTSALLDLAVDESYAVVAYVAAAVSGSAAKVMTVQLGPSGASCEMQSDGRMTNYPGPGKTPVSFAFGSNLAVVRPLIWYRDGGLQWQGVLSDLAQGPGSYDGSAYAGVARTLGTWAGATAAGTRFCWFAIYKGANAAGRDWKGYLQKLGWPLSW